MKIEISMVALDDRKLEYLTDKVRIHVAGSPGIYSEEDLCAILRGYKCVQKEFEGMTMEDAGVAVRQAISDNLIYFEKGKYYPL